MAELVITATGMQPIRVDGRIGKMVLALIVKRRQIEHCDAVQVTLDWFSKNQDLKMAIRQNYVSRDLEMVG